MNFIAKSCKIDMYYFKESVGKTMVFDFYPEMCIKSRFVALLSRTEILERLVF